MEIAGFVNISVSLVSGVAGLDGSRESSGIIRDGNMAPEIVSVKGSNPQFKRLVMLVIAATTPCGHSRSSKYAQEALKTFIVFKQDSATLKDRKVLMFETREGGALLRMLLLGTSSLVCLISQNVR